MAGDIRSKVKKVREQAEKASYNDKLLPREFQNLPPGMIDAYNQRDLGRNVRQGSNYHREGMKSAGEYHAKTAQKEREQEKTKSVFGVPQNRQPTWATVANVPRERIQSEYEYRQEQKKKKKQGEIADRLLKKGGR